MIERISELPWASFEAQLTQKCKNYEYTIPIADAYSSVYWHEYLDSAKFADEIYGIQHQILFNAIALNDEGSAIGQPLQENNDRFTDKDIYFWWDNVKVGGSTVHDGWTNTNSQRVNQNNDEVFPKNTSFRDDKGGTETLVNLTQLPKTYAAKSLIEVSEYVGPDNPESKHSNYVSRKVSMLWFFNVIKAIVKTLHTFPWIRIGTEVKLLTCKHPEAENNVHNVNSNHGAHTFYRSVQPSRIGYMRLYGNAEINGEVTTFHSQARFHDQVTMWDQLSVYGQSYFAKDINGTAMRTRWGDLAEYYSSDAEYEPGTLVKFGGYKEITIADKTANAVVTSNPGLVLNEDRGGADHKYEHAVAIALVGKVPVKVWGGCCKFDLLVADEEHPGWARVQINPNETPIARALETKTSERPILCATNFKL